MKKNLPVSFAVLICLMIVAGCTGHNKIAAQKKLAAMSDRDLVEHYKTVEMRLEDLDRAKAQSMEENERISKRDGPFLPARQAGVLHRVPETVRRELREDQEPHQLQRYPPVCQVFCLHDKYHCNSK